MDQGPALEPEPRIERIRELVDTLPKEEHLAVSLFFFGAEAPTLKDVARDMGVTEYRLKGILNRAYRKLREALQEEDGLGALLAAHLA